MTITTTITALPSPPNPLTDDSPTFSAKASAFTNAMVTFGAQLNSFATEVNTTQGQMNASQTGAAVGINYTFSTSTSAADPGAGFLRLNNATQNAATAMYASTVSNDGTSWATVLDQFTASTSTIKGFLKLHKVGDGTKWIEMTFTAMSSPSGYRNFTLTVIGASSASPFANGDALVLTYARNGDASSGGTAAISDIVSQTQNKATTGGSGTAFTLAPSSVSAGYVAGQTYWVTFHAACGENPTLTISGLATPPNLVKQRSDGTYVNLSANDFPANHRSKVTGLSASQYVVETLPVSEGASTFAWTSFASDYTLVAGDRGKLFTHNTSTPHTFFLPANSSLALPVGFTFTLCNPPGGGVLTISVGAGDNIYMVGSGATGARSLWGSGLCTLTKVNSTQWMISGGGLS